jgi:phage N-6-adenine-methyltransferase
LFGHTLPTRDELQAETAHRLRQMRIRGTTTNPGAGKSAHYSDEWYTPPEVPAKLGPFDLDPAAGPMRHAKENWGHGTDGLAKDWHGRVWLNPPYSNVNEWLDKFAAHGNGIALVNARPETVWFQRIVKQAHAVHWMRGRVNFIRPDGKATHPPVGSVLVAAGQANAKALQESGLPGVTMLVVGSNV